MLQTSTDWFVLSVVCCCCARIRNNKEDESGDKEVNQYHEVEVEDNYNQLEQGLMTIIYRSRKYLEGSFTKMSSSLSSPTWPRKSWAVIQERNPVR